MAAPVLYDTLPLIAAHAGIILCTLRAIEILQVSMPVSTGLVFQQEAGQNTFHTHNKSTKCGR